RGRCRSCRLSAALHPLARPLPWGRVGTVPELPLSESLLTRVYEKRGRTVSAVRGVVETWGSGKTSHMDDRFNLLETKLAYHENNLADLNAEVFRMARLIEALQAELKRVSGHVRDGGLDVDPTRHQPPPHY